MDIYVDEGLGCRAQAEAPYTLLPARPLGAAPFHSSRKLAQKTKIMRRAISRTVVRRSRPLPVMLVAVVTNRYIVMLLSQEHHLDDHDHRDAQPPTPHPQPPMAVVTNRYTVMILAQEHHRPLPAATAAAPYTIVRRCRPWRLRCSSKTRAKNKNN